MAIMILIGMAISLIAYLTIHTNLYNFEKEKRLKMIILAMMLVWLITLCIIFLTSGSMGQVSKEHKQIAKLTALLLFAPLNCAIWLPYLAHVINQYKQKQYTLEQTKKRMIIAGIIIILLIFFEVGYIQNFEIGLLQSAK